MGPRPHWLVSRQRGHWASLPNPPDRPSSRVWAAHCRLLCSRSGGPGLQVQEWRALAVFQPEPLLCWGNTEAWQDWACSVASLLAPEARPQVTVSMAWADQPEALGSAPDVSLPCLTPAFTSG